MKNFKTLFSLLIASALSISMAYGQADVMTEGFSGTPAGWTIKNSFMSGNNNGMYDGSKSVKLKSDGTTVTTSVYNSAAQFSFYYMPRAKDDDATNEGSTIVIQKSTDGGTTWVDVHTTTITAEEATAESKVWYKDSCDIDEASVMLKVSSSPAASMYVDDFRLTATPAAANNADLDSILINDGYVMAVKDQVVYNLDLLHTTSAVVVGATSLDPEATVTVVQASDVFSETEADRTATITIKSKDESVSVDYSIVINITDTLAFIDFSASTLYGSFYSSTAGYITSTPDSKGANTLPSNPASYSFVLNSILQLNAFDNVKTLSFNMALRKDLEGDFDILLYKYVGEDSTLLETINSTALTTTEWKKYSIAVDMTESVSFKFISTQLSENTTRIFIDDIAIIKGESAASVASQNSTKVSVYPNPAQDVLTISGVSGDFSVAIFSLNGALVLSNSNIKTMDVSSLASGSYLVKVKSNQEALVQKLIVE